MKSYTTFDVALSFAGEDRDIAEGIAKHLRDYKINVFYDRFFQSDLWGNDLYEHISDIYQNRAKFCVMLVSENYKTKKWTTHERKSAQARAFIQGEEYILPIRLDDTELPGLPETIGYIDYRLNDLNAIVDLIAQKIGIENESRLLAEREAILRLHSTNLFPCSRCAIPFQVDNQYFCTRCSIAVLYRLWNIHIPTTLSKFKNFIIKEIEKTHFNFLESVIFIKMTS